MNTRILCGILLALALVHPSRANQRAYGFCQNGNVTVVTNGVSSTTKVQGSFPGCTVTVFLSDGVTLATLYSDNLSSPTPLANPFVANGTTGFWFFYAQNGAYRVQTSGGGIPTPLIVGDILLYDPGTGTPIQLPVPDFNFTAQAPGGSISVGSNTVALTPCPRGVAGTNTLLFLYLSGGTGTAEAVPITGGTCVGGGSTNGNVIITAGNTHSGAWTVTSASGGWGECLNYLGATGGVCLLPRSAISLRNTLNIGNGNSSAVSTVNNLRSWGQGSGFVDDEGPVGGATDINWLGPAGQPMIKLNGPIGHIELTDMYLNCKPSTNQCSDVIVSSHASETHLARLAIGNHPNFAITQTAYSNPVGVSVGDADSTYEDIIINQGLANTATSSGIKIGASSWGSSPHLDVARSHYRNIQILCGGAGSVGIQLQFTDASIFENLFTLNCAKPLHVNVPSGTTVFPGGIAFYNPALIGTTPTSAFVTGTWGNPTKISFYPFHTGDGELIPNHVNFMGATDTNVYFGGGSIQANILGFGALCDNVTDDTAAIQAAITAVAAYGGGTVYIPVTSSGCRADGQITIPNDGASPVPSQKTIILAGNGQASNSLISIQQASAGSTLNLRYSGTGGKINSLGGGNLEVHNIHFKDTSSANATPFIYVTNTASNIHDNSFLGSVIGPTTTQTALMFGGTSTTRSGTITAPCGYQMIVRANFFDQVREAVFGRVFCNGMVIKDNTIGAHGGGLAAIHLDGDAGGGQRIDGGEIGGNIIELPGYTNGILLNHANNVTLVNNMLFDFDGNSVNGINLGAQTQYNYVVPGTRTAGGPTYVTDTSGNNNIMCFDQSGCYTSVVPFLAFASLPAAPSKPGAMIYCVDCAVASPCAGAGSGHMAVSNGTIWKCN